MGISELSDQMFTLDWTSSLKKLQEQDTLILNREVDTPVSVPPGKTEEKGFSVCPERIYTHVHTVHYKIPPPTHTHMRTHC